MTLKEGTRAPSLHRVRTHGKWPPSSQNRACRTLVLALQHPEVGESPPGKATASTVPFWHPSWLGHVPGESDRPSDADERAASVTHSSDHDAGVQLAPARPEPGWGDEKAGLGGPTTPTALRIHRPGPKWRQLGLFQLSLLPHSLVAELLVECGGSLWSMRVGDAGAAVRKPGHRCTQMGLRREFGKESQSKALHLHRLVTHAGEAGDTTRS